MNKYKKVLIKWILFFCLFLIFKYPLSKLLKGNDTYYILILIIFTIISLIQILNLNIKNK